MTHDRRVRLPMLEAVEFESFSLYRRRPNATIPIDRNVFCLAGANGLGKSTFIAAINYALTGGVTPTKPKIDQLPRYYRDAAAYSSKYFEGRIGELDREVASVSLTFSIGDSRYYLRRRFFRQFELEEFSVSAPNPDQSIENDVFQSAEDRQKSFEERVVRDTGLQTYPQFVFLQHFVFSFDENRHLLFWNSRATELVLYLAFGLDPSVARRVDELRKAESVEGSGARNAQYQATLARNELRSVLDQISPGLAIDEAVIAEYSDLQIERDRLTKERDEARSELADARLEFAECSARLMRTRDEYEHAFRRRLNSRGGAHTSTHQAVSQLLTDQGCAICGTQHSTPPERIQAAIDAGICPLCDAPIKQEAAHDGVANRDELVRLDEELASVTAQAKAADAATKRHDEKLRTAQRELARVISHMSSLDEEHESTLSLHAEHPDSAVLQSRAAQLQGAIDVALGRKEEHIQRRKEILAEYQPIQAELKQAWSSAELEFVPRFRAIAEDFIGLPLEVALAVGDGINGTAHLVLSVDSSHRRRSEQLSESQRFFLDIALRMSLAQHMTEGGRGSCLLIDTPEGALDISYEARAGDMFAQFSAEGDQIVMTANVNTSQLLLRLAERCGQVGMQLVRMTDWTSLSDVQLREESLFERAFESIERTLQGASTIE